MCCAACVRACTSVCEGGRYQSAPPSLDVPLVDMTDSQMSLKSPRIMYTEVSVLWNHGEKLLIESVEMCVSVCLCTYSTE